MAIRKLPRLAVNWLTLPEQFRRYWDQVMTAIEGLSSLLDETNRTPVTVAGLSSTPIVPRAIVSDATTKIFGDPVVGGGTETVPVYYTGAEWRIG